MANLRGLQEVAQILLRARLQEQADVANDERTRQRQLEVAKQNKDAVAAENEMQRQTVRLRQYGENPSLAFTASVSGDSEATPFIQKDRQILEPAFELISKAKNPEDLPSMEALWASRKPGIITNLQPFNELANAREAQNARIADTITAEVDQAGATSQAQQYGGAMGKEEADAANFGAQLGRKGQELEQGNKFTFERERGLIPIRAQTAGAETAARLKAELNPAVIAQRIDYETKRAEAQFVTEGRKVEAQALAKKTAAVKSLLPVYQKYRELASEVAIKSWAGGTNTSAARSAQSAMSHLPVIGEFVSGAMDAGHAAAAGAIGQFSGEPEIGAKVAQLNQLTEVLAQGMANAVIGNKGATTENDRRTAKGVLVNSFTEAKTAEELLRITDTMFGLLPGIAAAMPDATPADIINLAAQQAKTAGAAQSQSQQPVDPALAEARRKLNERSGR